MAATEASYSGLAGVRDAEARLLLSSLLRDQGHELQADCILLSVSVKGLWEDDALPTSATAPATAAGVADLLGAGAVVLFMLLLFPS